MKLVKEKDGSLTLKVELDNRVYCLYRYNELRNEVPEFIKNELETLEEGSTKAYVKNLQKIVDDLNSSVKKREKDDIIVKHMMDFQMMMAYDPEIAEVKAN